MRFSLSARLILATLVAGFATLPTPATAYVRTITKTNKVPTQWKTPCVTIEFSLGAFPAVLEASEYLTAAQLAGEAWNLASLDGENLCSNVAFAVNAVPDVAGKVGRDNHNRLIFRQDKWCRDPPPTDPNDDGCYDANALAITTVFQLKTTGEILDTDLEVNGVTFTWGDYTAHPEQFVHGTHDFQGAITHEFGHVIGLEHTCHIPGVYSDGTPVPRLSDNLGNPVPDCYSGMPLPSIVTEATMYISVSSPDAEVKLRTLSPDDAQGACDIYPKTEQLICQTPTQPQTTSGGCSTSMHPRSGVIGGVLVLLALAMVFRRRR
jgi:MYXO-CTERM domain-containing protein